MDKEKRYLGNTNTLEVHDTDNEKANCQLEENRDRASQVV
jgi:hypothetical protein